MIRSMTGYGRSEAQTASGRFTIEMRSVNHRFGEVIVRLPRDLTPLEDRVRTAVQGRVLRGRVEVTVIREDRLARGKTVRPDLDLAAAYAQALRDLARELDVTDTVTPSQVAAFPDVIRVEESKEDLDLLWSTLAPAVDAAAADLVGMREAEGRRLAEDLDARLARVDELGGLVAERSQSSVGEYAARLRERIAGLLGDLPVDEVGSPPKSPSLPSGATLARKSPGCAVTSPSSEPTCAPPTGPWGGAWSSCFRRWAVR